MKTNWLKTLREQAHIENQESLAKKLQLAGFSVTRAAVSHWENGRYVPPLKDPAFVEVLADILGVSVHSLLANAGFDIESDYSDNARHAAEIVDRLTPQKQKLALDILEQFLKEKV